MNIKVKGQQRLSGEINPSGSKNSAVALLPATLMFDKKVTLNNIPDITDVNKLVAIMQKLGSKIIWDKENKIMQVDNSTLSFEKVGGDDWTTMRGTSLLWGPMLNRFKKIDFSGRPGGCTLGYRTLLPHFEAFNKLGVKISEDEKGIKMDATKAKSSQFWLTEMSPTATENAVMMASGLPGKTKIVGVASEPQVQDLCNFLVSGGIKINGIGSSILEIEGTNSLDPVEHTLLSDHYEVATFLALGAITGGKVVVNNALPELFHHIQYVFGKFGIEIKYQGDKAVVEADQKIKIALNEEGRNLLTIKAQPWPSLPVDLLPIFIPLSLAAQSGQVLYHNWMYDSGLFWTSELGKLGANIIMCDPHRIITIAGNHLHGATIEAPYIIRAVVAMVMTAMIAEGETLILNGDALYRGHPFFAENLRRLGADIEEIK